jgi:hypothetical protein
MTPVTVMLHCRMRPIDKGQMPTDRSLRLLYHYK